MREVEIDGFFFEAHGRGSRWTRFILDLFIPRAWLWLRGCDGKDYNFNVKGRLFIRTIDEEKKE